MVSLPVEHPNGERPRMPPALPRLPNRVHGWPNSVTTTVTAPLGGRCAGPHTTHGRCRSLNTRMCVREIRARSSQVGCRRVQFQGFSLAQNRDTRRVHAHVSSRKHSRQGFSLIVMSIKKTLAACRAHLPQRKSLPSRESLQRLNTKLLRPWPTGIAFARPPLTSPARCCAVVEDIPAWRRCFSFRLPPWSRSGFCHLVFLVDNAMMISVVDGWWRISRREAQA